MNSAPQATLPAVFCSYAFTGEDEAVVRARMREVVAALEQVGCAVYCNLFDPAWPSYHTPGEFIRRALSVLPQYDMVLVVQASPRRSEGMLIEVGAALALGKPIALAQHHSVGQQSYLSDKLIATRTEVWRSEAELPAVVWRLVSNDSEIYQL